MPDQPHGLEISEQPIETMSDLMQIIQDDMIKIRQGQFTAEHSRILRDFHKLMLKGADLSIQYARLRRGIKPEKELRLIAEAEKANGKT